MTEDAKNILIEKMIDRPAELSPDDIQSILHDEELREIYDTSVLLRDAMISPLMSDPADEWKCFRSRLSPRRRQAPWLRYIAYAAAIVLLALVIPVAVRLLDHPDSPDSSLNIAQIDTAKMVAPSDPHPASVVAATHPVDDLSDPQVKAPAISTSKVAKSPSRSKPQPSPLDADIEQKVRTQLARIDNEVAMALAQVYQMDEKVASQAQAALCKADPTLPECNCNSQEPAPNDETYKMILL